MDVFRQDSGEILIDDKPFNPEDYKIGYLPEERGMYGKTKVRDQLVYFAMLRGATKQDALKSVEYWTERFEIAHYLDKKLETLSKGNQQKVQITQAFLNNPDILILDEPFSGLDPVNSQIFQDALSEYISDDRIIIFSSHQMSYVETFCDDIAIIDKGEIVLDGNLEEIKEDIGGNKKRVSSQNDNFESVLDNLGYKYSKDAKSYIIDLDNKEESNKLLKELMNQDVEIELFSAYKPTLQDIFIEKVGDAK